jgi:branched-chain amino acid transport system substrate-binding protein
MLAAVVFSRLSLAIRATLFGPNMRLWLTPLCSLMMVVLLGGSSCTRKGATGPALPPLELAASPEPRAEAEFREAKAARDAGRSKDAARRYRAFLSKWPTDPLVPFAKLEIGRIELDGGRAREARKLFEEVSQTQEPALAERGRMYAAITAARMGEHRQALEVLRPLVGRTVDPKETGLLLATVASSQEATGDELAALETRDLELSTAELEPAQRARAEERVRAIVKGLDPALELPRAYELLPHDGYAWPMVARQLLRVSFERGERERVSEIAKDLTSQGGPLDEELAALVLRAERSDSADPLVIGAILPLSGRGREVGEAALHGLLLSASEPGKPRVVYRDDGGDPQRALAALEDLVSLNRAVAIIGPLGAAPAQAVVERAADIGVPVITLSADASLTERSKVAFRMLAEPREEADALVRAAIKRNARKFVLMHPDNAWGQAMQSAFALMIAKRGARLVSDVAYPAATSSFVKEAEQLEKLDFDTLVLLDGAGKIALIAPTLAAKGIWSVAPGTTPPEGRAALFVIPAAGFDQNLAVNSRRYLQGALFSVPFDAADAPTFVASYREMFQAEPNLFSALGADAYRLVESALASGASTREDLARQLLRAQLNDPAATGAGFSETRGPREPGHLKTLLGSAFVRAD